MKNPVFRTMRDVAAHLGISHATVSRALRHDPRITEAVRRRVLQAAQQLGYRRDPKLAELMTHLRGSKQRAFHGTLAWVTDLDLANSHHRWLHNLYFGSASERAGKLGYKLELFTHATAEDAARLAHLLHTRGVRGIALLFFFNAMRWDDWKWDWSRFAFIYAGSVPSDAKLDLVDADYVANSVLLYETLARSGYRRIGVANELRLEQSMNYALCTARDLFARLHPHQPAFEPCLLPDASASAALTLQKWIKRHRVDCVATSAVGMRDLLAKTLRYRLPKDIGLASPGVDPKGDWTGVNQRDGLIAMTAVETLVASVEQGRFGIPECPRRILLPGVWHQGETCW